MKKTIPEHSNLARSSSGLTTLQQSLPLLTQLLSNPTVNEQLVSQQRTVDWKEIVRLWGSKEETWDADKIVVPLTKM